MRHKRKQTRIPMNRKRRDGFTLMEVLLVLAILVILGALVVFAFPETFQRAKIDATRSQISALDTPMKNYYLEYGEYPEQLQDLYNPPEGGRSGQTRRFMEEEIPNDPWGNAYQYERTGGSGEEEGYVIYSGGPDEGDGDDIYKNPNSNN